MASCNGPSASSGRSSTSSSSLRSSSCPARAGRCSSGSRVTRARRLRTASAAYLTAASRSSSRACSLDRTEAANASRTRSPGSSAASVRSRPTASVAGRRASAGLPCASSQVAIRCSRWATSLLVGATLLTAGVTATAMQAASSGSAAAVPIPSKGVSGSGAWRDGATGTRPAIVRDGGVNALNPPPTAPASPTDPRMVAFEGGVGIGADGCGSGADMPPVGCAAGPGLPASGSPSRPGSPAGGCWVGAGAPARGGSAEPGVSVGGWRAGGSSAVGESVGGKTDRMLVTFVAKPASPPAASNAATASPSRPTPSSAHATL